MIIAGGGDVSHVPIGRSEREKELRGGGDHQSSLATCAPVLLPHTNTVTDDMTDRSITKMPGRGYDQWTNVRFHGFGIKGFPYPISLSN